MIIKCHQAVKGSSSTQGYSAPMLESKDESRPGSTKSYSFVLNDDRRSIPDNDINNYVLEIEPVNGKFECTAAICTQYTDVGIPSVYTSWLMPEDGNSLTTLQILSRSSFMRGQEVADYYDNEKPLTMREVEVSTSADYSNWQIMDASRRLIGQFLALYWMSLIQNQPALGKAGNQLFLLLRDPGNNQIMVNEDAVRFFRKEIASRLPLEAQNMISAVFGVKKSEAEKNFRKAVCVVLSSEVGVPSDVKIDLLRGNQDLFRKINSLEDREAMKAIAECLLAGEQNYPEWYIRLRQQLKDGIPKTAAPYLMYYSYVLQGLEQETYIVYSSIGKNPEMKDAESYVFVPWRTIFLQAAKDPDSTGIVINPYSGHQAYVWISPVYIRKIIQRAAMIMEEAQKAFEKQHEENDETGDLEEFSVEDLKDLDLDDDI